VSTKKNSPTSRDQQYASFLKGIRLLGFAMLESRTNQDREAYVELLEKNRLTRRISTEYRPIEIEKDFFNASARLTLVMEDKRDPSSAAVVVECTYIAHFHCDGCQITKERAERFTESELRLVVWPYFRQFVNDMTSRMAIQPILIPFSAASEHVE
jgi:preprotein translocase subunit SecB